MSRRTRKSILDDERYFSDEDEYVEPVHPYNKNKNIINQEDDKIKQILQDQDGQDNNHLHQLSSSSSVPQKGGGDESRRTINPYYNFPTKNIKESGGDDTEDEKARVPASSSDDDEDEYIIEEELWIMGDAAKKLILTKDLAQRGISSVFKGMSIGGRFQRGNKKLMEEDKLRKVLALHLQNKGFRKIVRDAFSPFKSLAHLYLNNNEIMKMNGFQCLPQLETLHLSGNRIRRIENLNQCFNLRELHLGQNEIEVVEGLDNLSLLLELHLEHQRLPTEEPLVFGLNALRAISGRLKLLNLGGNQLEDIEDLIGLDVLDTLNLSQNKLRDLDHVSQVLRILRQLRSLDLRENPIGKLPKYKEKIVGMCYGLEHLDGRPVNEAQKTALQRMSLIKANRSRQQIAKNMGKGVVGPPASSFPPSQSQKHFPSLGLGQMSIPLVHDTPNQRESTTFVFSTPISTSPTPANNDVEEEVHHHPENQDQDPNVQKEVEVLYAGRETIISLDETDSAERERMSEMAKMIFRLSNLSSSGSGSGIKKVQSPATPSRNSRAVGDRISASSFQECRPLSPLEIDVNSAHSSQTVSGGRIRRPPPSIRRPMTRKLPPRSGVGVGRILSPLEELPTPDSTKGRDQLEEINPTCVRISPHSSATSTQGLPATTTQQKSPGGGPSVRFNIASNSIHRTGK